MAKGYTLTVKAPDGTFVWSKPFATFAAAYAVMQSLRRCPTLVGTDIMSVEG